LKLFTKRRVVWGLGIGLPALALMLLAIPMFNLFHAHEHCIKGTGLSLRTYALDHGGRFPFHTNGFGDAILLLIKELGDDPRLFTAPGDDGRLFKECLKTGAHMPEDRCTRAYVQGLSDTNNFEIALVFDRYPTRGGDHFRRPWGPLLREVAMLDGSMEVIREEKWPEFRRKQIELLVGEGISRARAEKLYAPFK
jgi:hypothetical protein